MSEKKQCTLNVKNTTGGTLSCTNTTNLWGHWTTSPPIQIANGTTGSFEAQGTKGTATGTQGSATYTLPDNATTFTINFDIPFTGANSGGGTLGGTGMSNYSVNETEAGFVSVVSFPSGGSAVTVYFAIAPSAQAKPADFTASLEKRLKVTRNAPAVNPTMDMPAISRYADCGEITGAQVIELFKGKTVATALDILTSQSVPPGDLVRLVTSQSMIAPTAAFTAAIDFADHVKTVFKHDPPQVLTLAEDTIAALRKSQSGTPDPNLNKFAIALEEVKGGMLAQRDRAPYLPSLYVIDAILACIYMEPAAALLQSGSCARDTGTTPIEYETISIWQRDYLKKIS